MSADVPLFDPAAYAACRRPLLEARSLPAWSYTSPAFFERELERCFRPHWHFVGHESELPRPGDYLAVDLVIGPALVLRGRDGTLRAFANVCRHRGSRLVASGKGHAGAIACPYHSWTYGLDGALQGAPGMKAVAGFERRDWGLLPLRLESWHGLLWITADDDAPALTDHLGDFADKFACYDFAAMTVVRRAQYDIACNWKLLAENSLEDYHTGTVHKTSLGQQHSVPEHTRGHWCALYMPQDTTIAVLPGETTPLPHIPTLAGRPAKGTYFTMVYPNTQFALTLDCMWWLTFHPLAVDRLQLRVGFCFPRATAARTDFAAAAQKYFQRWDTGIAEDNGVGPLQQAGLQVAGRAPGPFAPNEFCVHKFQNWILDQVLDAV